MPPLAAIGVTIYKGLLALYPSAFRRKFASDMVQDFEDASCEAWAYSRWRGVLSLWLFTGADALRNVPIQWLRSETLIITVVSLVFATFCAAVVSMLGLRVPYMMQPSSAERDGLLVLILVTSVVVIIAATVLFSLMFLRPALTRRAGRRRV